MLLRADTLPVGVRWFEQYGEAPMGSTVVERLATWRAAGLVVLALTLAPALMVTTNAYAVQRNTVIARAQTWIDRPVPYSQSTYFGGYRTDCSGYVSMCWTTGWSWNTRTFHSVATTIPVDHLLPGDSLLKAGTHIKIFYGWVDDAHTMFVCYEQTGPTTKSSIQNIAHELADGYKPYRYEHIAGSPAPRNLLRNGSLDVWAKPVGVWPVPPARPVWWTFAGSRDATLTAHVHNLVKATYNSVQLINPSTSAKTFTDMSQEVTVTPETTYTLSAWARTACSPSGVEVHLDYLDAEDQPIATRRLVGSAAAVNGSTFREISTTVVSPKGAVRALVTLRLAGGTTSISETQTVPGTSAVFDEISLVRPQAAIGLKANAATFTIGHAVTLTGSVTPTAAVGAMSVMYMQKPGSSVWVRMHGHPIYATSTGAAMKCKYTFASGSRKGVYKFRAEVLAFAAYPGWAGSGMSSSVSVTLR